MLLKEHIFLVFLFFFCIFVFSRGLGIHGLEYRDDEIFYYKSTQEMLYNNNYLTPTYFKEYRFQKPILYYWLILASYKIFGVSWSSARMVSVIFAALCVCLTWIIANLLFNKRVAGLSGLILMTTPMFFRHAKNAVPDMALNFFTLLAVYSAIKFFIEVRNKGAGSEAFSFEKRYSVLFFVSCGLGFMVKGFVPLVIPLMLIISFFIFDNTISKNIKVRINTLLRLGFFKGFIILLIIVAPWFIYMVKKHGLPYLDYMLVVETKNRFIGQERFNIFHEVTSWARHIIFYLRVIASYFAPWSLFFFIYIFYSVFKGRRKENYKSSLLWLHLWFVVAFSFFCPMYFVINHYILILTTPFAILVSYFLLIELPEKGIKFRLLHFVRRYMLIFILSASFIAFTFLLVFLVRANILWLPVSLLFYVCFLLIIKFKRDLLYAPLLLSLFMVFVFSRSSLLEKAGLTSHAILQKFAQTINEDKKGDFVIVVGSHDIHEKEFQAYFDQKAQKAGTSNDEETSRNLEQLFDTREKVYCLIMESDYRKYLKNVSQKGLDIIQEDYIFRRRIYPDRKLLIGLIKFDKEIVFNYFMEKIILIRKDKDA